MMCEVITLTILRLPSVCISASIPMAGVNSSLSKTRFTTRVKSPLIVTKFISVFKKSDKYRHNLLKPVTFLSRPMEQDCLLLLLCHI